MPTKHAAIKHLRQTVRRTAQNRTAKDALKRAVKSVRTAAVAKDKAKATEALKKTIKLLDRAAHNLVIPKNRASRLKSRLSKQVRAIA
ncbi:MAG: 30S ribosomal protein S20 [Patescibacteria group bacterium]